MRVCDDWSEGRKQVKSLGEDFSKKEKEIKGNESIDVSRSKVVHSFDDEKELVEMGHI